MARLFSGAAASSIVGSGTSRESDVPGSQTRECASCEGRRTTGRTRDGKLAGRPDFFDGHTIVEYKSSIPDRSSPRAAEIRDGYSRQLRLYAAILADVEKRWPTRGRVVAAGGQAMNFKVDPGECRAEAEAAVEMLIDVNGELCRGVAPETLARPDSESCAGCPFQAICPAFWDEIERRDFNQASAAAAVEVVGIEVGYDADLFTAKVTIIASSCPIVGDQTIVLRGSVHGDLTQTGHGDKWRVVSAAMRADRRLRADLSTIVLPENSIPRIVVATNGQ